MSTKSSLPTCVIADRSNYWVHHHFATCLWKKIPWKETAVEMCVQAAECSRWSWGRIAPSVAPSPLARCSMSAEQGSELIFMLMLSSLLVEWWEGRKNHESVSEAPSSWGAAVCSCFQCPPCRGSRAVLVRIIKPCLTPRYESTLLGRQH